MKARVAFYLPVVTPWWFDHAIGPMIRVMARSCEVHVLVPPFWSGTGIVGEQLGPFLSNPDIQWHILDRDDHPQLRTSLEGQDELIDLMAAIDPDIVLCRSADLSPADLFPGEVRFIMEGGLPPLLTGATPVVIYRHALFPFGTLPDLSAAERDNLWSQFAPIWERLVRSREAVIQPDWRSEAGVDPDRKVALLVGEYEHPEIHFGIHRHWPRNRDWLDEVAASLDPDIFIAVTVHPLSEQLGSDRPLERRVAKLGDRAAIIRRPNPGLRATEMVLRDCDGAMLDLSKACSMAAFYGVPIFRRSAQPTAPWFNATDDFDAFSRVVKGAGPAPDPEAVRLWFAYHAANCLIEAGDPNLTAEAIIDHVRNPINPGRWETNLARMRAFQEGLALC